MSENNNSRKTPVEFDLAFMKKNLLTLHCQSDDLHGVLATPPFAFQQVFPTKLLQSDPVPQ
jgi:hypothetical protein